MVDDEFAITGPLGMAETIAARGRGPDVEKALAARPPIPQPDPARARLSIGAIWARALSRVPLAARPATPAPDSRKAL